MLLRKQKSSRELGKCSGPRVSDTNLSSNNKGCPLRAKDSDTQTSMGTCSTGGGTCQHFCLRTTTTCGYLSDTLGIQKLLELPDWGLPSR